MLPLDIYAYSDKVIVGGHNIGIEINNNGVLVIGFYKIDNKYNRNKLEIGDTIVKVNGNNVLSISDLLKYIESANDDKVVFTIKRNNRLLEKDFTLVKKDGKYKTGLYVKDNITGIGTLTYIDPETKIFGALGHEVIESNSGNLIDVYNGSIFKSVVTSIDKSIDGLAGTKNARFYSDEKYGTVEKNTNKGIFGIIDNDEMLKYDLLEVGSYSDIKEGKAYIRTVIDGSEIKDFEIYIDKINKNETKNLHFIIKSDELISKTGGIVQGMSGSPIIQNNKIIGAVTHVIVDKPVTGYGILITSMLKEGES